MKISLAYGSGMLPVEFPDDCTTVIEPTNVAPLSDERATVLAALEAPIAARPLREWITPDAKICISFSDITRATPNERIIPWLLDYLDKIGVSRESITLINQTGTHRSNTRAELETMLTPEVVANHRVINHECENDEMLVQVGKLPDGTPIRLNRYVVEADVRIVTGFIEPHFFAGFSGGPKGIMPGTAALETVMYNHGAHHISSPEAAFGITEGNPLWENIRDIALMAGRSFVLNVTLDTQHRITGVFAGDLIEAHKHGCAFVRETAMQPVKELFDIVVTTNSGYPLDQNFYQAVKGMSAGARIVKPSGLLIIAAECREGIPVGSPFERLARTVSDTESLLAKIQCPGFRHPEQWQSHIQALIQRKCRVLVYSSLDAADLRALHLEPCNDIAVTVREALTPNARVAVLPYGPLTVPYLRD